MFQFRNRSCFFVCSIIFTYSCFYTISIFSGRCGNCPFTPIMPGFGNTFCLFISTWACERFYSITRACSFLCNNTWIIFMSVHRDCFRANHWICIHTISINCINIYTYSSGFTNSNSFINSVIISTAINLINIFTFFIGFNRITRNTRWRSTSYINMYIQAFAFYIRIISPATNMYLICACWFYDINHALWHWITWFRDCILKPSIIYFSIYKNIWTPCASFII